MSQPQQPTPIEVSVSQLKNHPVNATIYGEGENIDDLKEIIERTGRIDPLVVNRSNNHVVAGNRRLKYCREYGRETVLVIYKEFASPEEELEMLLSDNVSRDKSPEQKIREGIQWEALLSAAAKDRSLANLSSEGQNLAPQPQGKTRDRVAKLVGLGSGYNFSKGKSVVQSIDVYTQEGKAEASYLKEALRDSINAAYKLLKEYEKEYEKNEQRPYLYEGEPVFSTMGNEQLTSGKQVILSPTITSSDPNYAWVEERGVTYQVRRVDLKPLVEKEEIWRSKYDFALCKSPTSNTAHLYIRCDQMPPEQQIAYSVRSELNTDSRIKELEEHLQTIKPKNVKEKQQVEQRIQSCRNDIGIEQALQASLIANHGISSDYKTKEQIQALVAPIVHPQGVDMGGITSTPSISKKSPSVPQRKSRPIPPGWEEPLDTELLTMGGVPVRVKYTPDLQGTLFNSFSLSGEISPTGFTSTVIADNQIPPDSTPLSWAKQFIEKKRNEFLLSQSQPTPGAPTALDTKEVKQSSIKPKIKKFLGTDNPLFDLRQAKNAGAAIESYINDYKNGDLDELIIQSKCESHLFCMFAYASASCASNALFCVSATEEGVLIYIGQRIAEFASNFQDFGSMFSLYCPSSSLNTSPVSVEAEKAEKADTSLQYQLGGHWEDVHGDIHTLFAIKSSFSKAGTMEGLFFNKAASSTQWLGMDEVEPVPIPDCSETWGEPGEKIPTNLKFKQYGYTIYVLFKKHDKAFITWESPDGKTSKLSIQLGYGQIEEIKEFTKFYIDNHSFFP